MKYIAPLNGDMGNENRSYIDANPVHGVEGSIPTAKAIEHPMREVLAVITGAGLSPDDKNLTQLYQSIMAIFQREIASLGTEALYMRPWVGRPIPIMNDVLPENHMWLTGGLASFADYPELGEDYFAHKFKVTDIYSESTVHTFVKHLNASGLVDGLYMPSSAGLFPRIWGAGQEYDVDRIAGSYQGDAIRNITGNLVGAYQSGRYGLNLPIVTGALTRGNAVQGFANILNNSSTDTGYGLAIDASLQVPTTDTITGENRPKNYAQPTAIYLGRHA